VLALGFMARRTHAEPLPLRLDWEAPPECPTQADVLGELARITRVKPGRVVTPVYARAKIELAGRKYRLHLRTERDDQTGDTDLDAADCLVLKRGVTLVLALALGDGVDVMDEKPAEDSVPPKPTPTEPVTPPTVKRAPPRAPRSRDQTHEKSRRVQQLRAIPAIAGLAARGFSGEAAFGAQLSLALQTVRLGALAEAGLWPEHTAARVQGVSAQLEAVTGSLGACARDPLRQLDLSVCARFTLGAIHARSQGAYRDGSSTAAYYGLGPALVLTAPLAGGVTLRAEVALDVALAPPRFAERDFGQIYAISRFIPQFSLGLALKPRR